MVEETLVNIEESAEVETKKTEKGASLVEYALLVALIAIAAIVAVRSIGSKVSAQFSNIAGQL